MASDAPDTNKATITCPETSWVHAPLMDEYKGMKNDPSVKVSLEIHAWQEDFYKLELKGKTMRVAVDAGGDPKNPHDVWSIAKDLNEDEHRSISDIYDSTHRKQAGFYVEDPNTHDTLAKGLAMLYESGNVRQLEGTTYDSNEKQVFFTADFDEGGKRTRVGTLNSSNGEFTPMECK